MKKTSTPKHDNLCQKASNMKAKSIAETHQKAMPKLVTKRIRKIIKNHVSLKGRVIEIHWENNGS